MWYIIINPMAGSGKAQKTWSNIQAYLNAVQLPFKAVFTERANHATELCKQAITNGVKKIIAVGGDGTLNEVMNGIFQQQIVPSTDITLAIIPIGTGNDWIKTHQIPNDYKAAIDLIKQEATTYQDVGLAFFEHENQQKERYFMNVAGLAYDGFVGKLMAENKALVSNKLSYLWMVFRCLFQYKLRKAKVNYDGQEAVSKFYTINVGLCKYSGGGMQFVPHAVPDDGLFALTLARKISKLEVVFATPFLYNGQVDKLYFIKTAQVKSIKIEALDTLPTHLEIDGEYVGTTPVEFKIIKKGLKVVSNG